VTEATAAEHPDGLRYTREHEWLTAGDGDRIRVGITGYAQAALGDIVYVTLPGVGTEVRAGEPLGEVESTKSVSDVYAPVSGTVAARNEALDDRPELVNSDPYGAGWMVEIDVTDAAGALQDAGLLDAAAYQSYIEAL
jgi:glycine cleavage system H protein